MTSKYLWLDHAGLLVHAHYSFVRPCEDTEYLKETLGNVLTTGGYGKNVAEDAFHSAFEVAETHPLSPRSAGHGASGLRSPSNTSRKRTKSNESKGSSVKSNLTDCPGCKNGHSKHLSSCPLSTVHKKQVSERKALDKAETEAKRASSVPVQSRTSSQPTSSREKEKPSRDKDKRKFEKYAKGTPNIGRYFSADRSEVGASVNLLEVDVGDTVKFRDPVSTKTHVSRVVGRDGDQLRLRGDDLTHSKVVHVQTCTKIRTVRTKDGTVFGTLPAQGTSYSNSERLVQMRQKALNKANDLNVKICNVDISEQEILEISQIIAGNRELVHTEEKHCLFASRVDVEKELSDCSTDDILSNCSDFSHASDLSEFFATEKVTPTLSAANVHSITSTENDITISVAIESNSSTLPKRAFKRAHEAADIEFEQLPADMQRAGFRDALADYEKGNCWKAGGTLREWKNLRRNSTHSEKGPNIVVMDSTWVCKAVVDEGSKDPPGPHGFLRGKVRLAPRGFREKNLTKNEVASPTINPISMRIAETIALQKQVQEDFVPLKVDFKRAFFQIDIPIDPASKRIGLVLPKECQEGRTGDDRLVRELLKEVPGTKGAPRDWYLTITRVLTQSLGFTQSRVDPCLFTRWENGKLVAMLYIHVDDARVWISRDKVEWFRAGLRTANIETRYVLEIPDNTSMDLVGLQWLTNEKGTFLSQKVYVERTLKLIPLSKLDLKQFSQPGSVKPGSDLYKMYRTRLGQLIWLEKTRMEIGFDVSILASLLAYLSTSELLYINDVINTLKESPDLCLFLPRLPCDREVEVQALCDASLAGRVDESSQGGRAIGLTVSGSDVFAPVDVSSRRVRRRGSSSFDVEMLVLVETADTCIVVGLLVEELLYGVRPSLAHRMFLEIEGYRIKDKRTKCTIDTDARDAVERIYSLKDSLTVSKRRRTDIADCQELLVFSDVTEFRHIHGATNAMDCLTKKYGRYGLSKAKAAYQRFLDLLYSGKYDADLTSVDRNGKLQTVKCAYIGCCHP